MNKPKRLYLLSVIFLVLISGCQTKIPSIASYKKPPSKPTEKGALAFAKKYWGLMNKQQYAEGYELLVPADKKLVSKKAFVGTRTENKIAYKTTVGPAVLNGNEANVTLFTDTPLGRTSTADRIVFQDGKWFQKLETVSLIDYGVNPKKISTIKQAAIGQAFEIPAFSATVQGANKDKTITSDYGSRATAQGIFIIVKMQVTNTGKQQFSFNGADYVSLVDGASRSFALANIPESKAFGDINPGMSDVFTLAFDVPDNASGFSMLVGQENDMFLVPLGL